MENNTLFFEQHIDDAMSMIRLRLFVDTAHKLKLVTIDEYWSIIDTIPIWDSYSDDYCCGDEYSDDYAYSTRADEDEIEFDKETSRDRKIRKRKKERGLYFDD